MGLLDVFLGPLEVTLPVFAMVIIGILLGRMGWIDTHFINTASGLVFKATMPTLLFLSNIKADLGNALQPGRNLSRQTPLPTCQPSPSRENSGIEVSDPDISHTWPSTC